MRALFFDEADLCDQTGRPLTCTYWIMIRDLPPPVSCESYGIRIRVRQTGEEETVPDVTVLPERIARPGPAAGTGYSDPMYPAGGDPGLALILGDGEGK